MRAAAVPEYLKSYVGRGPSYLILYVTSRCNPACSFCFYADSLNAPWKDGLSLDEITSIAGALRHCSVSRMPGGRK